MAEIYDFMTSGQFLLPLAFLAGSLVLGFLAEKIVLRILKKVTARTKWGAYEALKNGLRGMITLLFVTAGLYFAIRLTDFSPEVLVYYQRALMVLVIFSLTVAAVRVTAGLVDIYVRKAEGAVPSTTILGNMLRIVIFLTGLLVVLSYLDIPIAPIITALGIGGFAVALAFQDTLSNLFSGLHILASRLVKPGDFIKLDTGEEGYVADVTWRNTTIRTLPNNMVVVPNSRLASAIITNYNQPRKEMAVLVDVGVDYASDLGEVEEVTVGVAADVLREVPGGSGDFKPFVRFHTFSEYRIEFTVVLRVNEYVDQYRLKHEFVKRLHRAYREHGIDIPLPARTISFAHDRESMLSGIRG
ncbi:MAG: mechanosensitive ion channel family protein [Actinomycetota bacterium]|nr:mechanosensitive ion channel family protein [Actinomycetota bacterium]MDD5668040.1 mechanosensitive ion channel family protein [Actinomycetota bacterium]